MKAWEIVGWTYDADVHCEDCAIAAGMTKDGAKDSEGNEPHPIFASDEGWESEHCGDCGVRLDGEEDPDSL